MDIKLIKDHLLTLDLSISDYQANQLKHFYTLLSEQNKKMNLTALTSEEDFLVKHLLDSLLILKRWSFNPQGRLIDIGTGAGFPGIPLKIIFPEMDIVLVDATKKKVDFLKDVIVELKLNKVIPICARAEEIAHQESYRQQFDYCVARAVMRLDGLSELCVPFVKQGGYFIPFKGSKGQQEVDEAKKAINQLGAVVDQVIELMLMTGIEEGKEEQSFCRVFPIVKKIKKTNLLYPRQYHKIKKEPLR